MRLNNRLRRSVEAALGGLTLLAADPAKRYEAAQAVFKSRDASALPTLDAALAKETDARVKRALTEARAAVILFQADAKENDKLAAVAVIRDARRPGFARPARRPAGRAAAAGATRRRRRRSRRSTTASRCGAAVQNAWYGLSLGSVLLLAAIGLAITFGVMGVINMAHGEMVMLGAYTTFVVQEIIRSRYPGLFDCRCSSRCRSRSWSPGSVGIVIERGVIRFLYGRPLETLLATWGLSLILQQAVRTAFGPTNKEVGNPSWMSGAFELGGITITYNRHVDHRVHARGVRRAARRCCASPGSASRCAR